MWPYWTHIMAVCLFSLRLHGCPFQVCRFSMAYTWDQADHIQYISILGSRNLPCILSVGYYPVIYYPEQSITPSMVTAVFRYLRFLSLSTFRISLLLIWLGFIYLNLLSLNYWHYCMTLTSKVIKLLDTNYTKSFHADEFLLNTIKELFNIGIKASSVTAFIHHQLCPESQLLFFPCITVVKRCTVQSDSS